ncbi:transcriptional regulator, TetR family [Amycolatopsis marina]|uniref:Transcriptional regulator, TetR family n=1 Tax=Amycolatopsis marina TaxID=490629 RepID=A0A1I1BFT0_9PSEU|nr:TetR/AcrR family transcriptional regulator [Amycolatopsis marina]SFB48612.1 transcriptional regulator, TetR family [Amycolatopsis marina]
MDNLRMPPDRSSAGDPARTLELLWRQPGQGGSARGPKQGRTVDEVVRSAIELADAAGLDAVTIRRVAQALGVSPMSVYTYVPGKAELIDLMLDAVYAEMPRRAHGDAHWRDRVTAIARANRALFDLHPWVAAVSTTRPPLGPGLMAKYEHELLAFEGVGLDDVEMDSALTFVLGFVQSSAKAALDAHASTQDSAMNDEEWWAANQPLLARVFDETAFPTATRVGSAAGAAHGGAHNPCHAYEFGLRRVLDGIAVLIEERDR